MPVHTEIKAAILDKSLTIVSKRLDMVNRGLDRQYQDEVLEALVSDETIPFCFADAGIGWDSEDRNFTYPEVNPAEIQLADQLPVPHASMLIETKVDMPVGMPVMHCLWLLGRIGGSGYSAKPVTYRPADKTLIVHNTVFDFVPGRTDAGQAPKMVYQLLNKQEDYFHFPEFERQQDLLSRFFCLINRSRTFARKVQADAALNKRRVARGRPEIRDYHVVRVGERELSYLNSLTRKHGTSPCEHRRRSHVRKYRSGRIGIVRNSIVNKGKEPNGPVPQVFVVESPAD